MSNTLIVYLNRICNDFVVIKGQSIKGRIKVTIVRKLLGY